MAEQTFITQEWLDKLKEELNYLKNTKRKEIAKRIQDAKELGDLSENAEYADAKNEQAFMEGRIQEIESIIRSAKIIQKDTNNISIQIGSQILVKDESQEKEFTIVGSKEADPVNGLISNESPLGRAFIGRKVGDKVEVDAPKGRLN